MAGVTATVDYFSWVGQEIAHARYRGAGSERCQIACAGMAALGEYELPRTKRLIDGLLEISGVTVHGITSSNALSRRVPHDIVHC